MIDWGRPLDADRGLSLEDYVCRFLKDAVDFILREHARKDLHMLGYCMGGTLATLVRRASSRAGQDAHAAGRTHRFQRPGVAAESMDGGAHFDVDAFIDTHGNCPAWFLQTSFLWLKPIQNFIEKSHRALEQMEDPRAITSYFAMERWVNDNVPVAGETFREFVKKLYQDNELVTWRLPHRRATCRSWRRSGVRCCWSRRRTITSCHRRRRREFAVTSRPAT